MHHAASNIMMMMTIEESPFLPTLSTSDAGKLVVRKGETKINIGMNERALFADLKFAEIYGFFIVNSFIYFFG